MAPSSPDHYTVAIICSLGPQLDAIQQMFDEPYLTPLIDRTEDRNSYTCGCINGHNVVVANKALYETGLLKAFEVLTDLERNFKELIAVLVVGTAGGIPSKEPKPDAEEDIHLGDVVVGWPGPGQPAVVQWDSGVSGVEQFTIHCELENPDVRLRNALGKLMANRDRPGGLDRFKENLNRCLAQKRFAHPALESDVLFDSAYDHPQANSSCKNCDISRIIARPPRKTTAVKVHYGTIASGSSVLKAGKERDRVRDTTKAICVEMSAAGVVTKCKALVIKGVSDYADSHKSEDMAAWRSYASATAAAFTRELLCTMDPGKLKDIKQISQGIDFQEQKSQIAHWLAQKTDPSILHNAAQDKHDDYTGRWFTEGESYSQWKEILNSFLWLYGIPGAGKTILCSEIIKKTQEHCVDHPESYLAYFYFSFTQEAKRDDFLRSVISQLLDKIPTLPQAVHDLYTTYRNLQPSSEALENALHSLVTQSGQIFIIVDAIDECPEGLQRDGLLASMTRIHKWAMPNLHILATSRKIADIEDAFAPISEEGSLPPISITEEVDSDIRRHIKNQLETRKLMRWPQDIKQEIEDRLVEGAKGMFRWVFCQLESLKDCPSVNSIRAALRSLPATLDETYERILKNIHPNHRKYAVAAVHWIAFSLRPLRVRELAEAVIIDPQTDIPIDINDRVLPQLIPEMLSSLVVVDDRRGSKDRDLNPDCAMEELTVSFAHFSVQEYLISERLTSDVRMFKTSETTAHYFIGESCLKYVSEFITSNAKESEKVVLPLWKYACGSNTYFPKEGWSAHANAVNSSLANTVFSRRILTFLNLGSKFANWFQEYDGYKWQNVGESPLYHAIFLDLHSISIELIKNGAEINAQGGYYRNALQAASFRGNEAIAKLLIENEAEVNAQGGYYGNALQAASSNGNKVIAKLLIENGAEVNAQGGYYGNALQAASFRGNEAIVKLLIQKGAGINAQAGHLGNALQAASYMGNEAIAKLLIQKGADINTQGGFYGNALQAASYWGNKAIVTLLIQKGADINAKGGHYGNALQAASYCRNEAIAKLLIENGAEVNAKGGLFGNALSANLSGSWGRNPILTHLLINSGANLDTLDQNCYSELREACEENSELKSLVEEKGFSLDEFYSEHESDWITESKSETSSPAFDNETSNSSD